MREYEIALPRRVRPQCVPFMQNGGDCGACVLGGLLGLSIGETYESYNNGKIGSFHWSSMRDALWTAESRGILDRVITDVPVWPWSINQPFCEWGMHAGFMSIAWFHYVSMAIEAGYYGLALVDIHKKGPFGGGTDHWVLVCGARVRRVPMENSKPDDTHVDYRIDNEILISCSSTRTADEEWVGPGKFLTERGGFNLLLARPTGGTAP